MDRNEFKKRIQYNYVLCYFQTNRKVTAYNLWDNSITTFRNSIFYREWERIKQLNPLNFEESVPYIKDSITEKTRIILCFENFIKGQLILNDVLVHRISKKHKNLKQQQEDRPVFLNELADENTFKYLDTKDQIQFDWTNFTLPFSTLTKENYQRIVNLPDEILTVLKDINTERNNLHFLSSLEFTWGQPVIEQYERLISFVDEVIEPNLLSLQGTLEELRNKKRS
jgi:hypothetical protein